MLARDASASGLQWPKLSFNFLMQFLGYIYKFTDIKEIEVKNETTPCLTHRLCRGEAIGEQLQGFGNRCAQV